MANGQVEEKKNIKYLFFLDERKIKCFVRNWKTNINVYYYMGCEPMQTITTGLLLKTMLYSATYIFILYQTYPKK